MQVRLLSWNVNGIRAAIKKGFWESLRPLEADVVCIQETKTDTEK
jgi:exodeoxyribonuclease-3